MLSKQLILKTTEKRWFAACSNAARNTEYPLTLRLKQAPLLHVCHSNVVPSTIVTMGETPA